MEEPQQPARRSVPGTRAKPRDEGRCSWYFSMTGLILVPVNTHCHSDFRVSPARRALPVLYPPPPPAPGLETGGEDFMLARDPGLLNSWISSA